MGADTVTVRDENNVGTNITLVRQPAELAGRADFDFFGFVVGTATIDFGQSEVNVDLPAPEADLVNARLTTITLTILGNDNEPANGVEKGLFIGVNGVGFSLNSATISVASLKPPAPTPPSTTPTRAAGPPSTPRLTGATLRGPRRHLLAHREIRSC